VTETKPIFSFSPVPPLPLPPKRTALFSLNNTSQNPYSFFSFFFFFQFSVSLLPPSAPHDDVVRCSHHFGGAKGLQASDPKLPWLEVCHRLFSHTQCSPASFIHTLSLHHTCRFHGFSSFSISSLQFTLFVSPFSYY